MRTRAFGHGEARPSLGVTLPPRLGAPSSQRSRDAMSRRASDGNACLRGARSQIGWHQVVSVSGAAAGGGAAGARSLLRCFEPGIPCHCDRRARERRSRARRIHDARAIFAESGPQREATFSADVQRRARKQAQRRRCRAAWAGRVQWRGAAGSDVHRVAPRARRSARAGQEALGRLKRTSALIAGRDRG